MIGWLQQADGETDLTALGFTNQEVQEAIDYSHLLRNRFNINKLRHLFGIDIVVDPVK
jgi:hypothetical protein